MTEVAFEFKICEHVDFAARVNVARQTAGDGGPLLGFVAEITIRCTKCGIPFRFIGVEPGFSRRHPMASLDGDELRAPIEPAPDAAA